MTLTTEQVTELTNRMNDRLNEFDAGLAGLSRGTVRLMVDVYDAWCREEISPLSELDDMTELADAWPAMPDLPDGVDHFAEHPVAGEPLHVAPAVPEPIAESYTNGNHAPQLTPQAVATLGPEHTVVTPLKSRAHLPTMQELVKEVRRQAMGGVMPTMAAFDAARPANWATAQAHLIRLGLTWSTLAEKAELKARGGK